MSQFHGQNLIAESDYYKRIIRFPRFKKPCDKGNVSGTRLLTQINKRLNERNENEHVIEKQGGPGNGRNFRNRQSRSLGAGQGRSKSRGGWPARQRGTVRR